MESFAIISDCGRYRYQLGRIWEPSKGLLSATLHNASTADAAVNDPTVRRLFTFAERLGKGGFIVTNTCAGRTMSPKVLRAMEDPRGPDNDKWLRDAAVRADLLLVGWGAAHRSLQSHIDRAIALLRETGKPLWCLGKTNAGAPRHPLYVPSDKVLEPWPNHSESTSMSGFKLLPPSPDVCQECAVKHEPEQAHNKDSLYYQYQFRSEHGRWPVWKDAIAHCPPEIKEVWEQKIKEAGAWKEPEAPDACPMDDGTIGTVTTIPIRHEKEPWPPGQRPPKRGRRRPKRKGSR